MADRRLLCGRQYKGPEFRLRLHPLRIRIDRLLMLAILMRGRRQIGERPAGVTRVTANARIERGWQGSENLIECWQLQVAQLVDDIRLARFGCSSPARAS